MLAPIVGATTQHFASADVTSGDRPVLVPIETCRIADTRAAPNTVGPKSTPLAAADTMTVNAQQAGTDCTGQIPATATALSLNITALNATSNSFITIWPDGDRPTASTLNPEPGTRVFNAVTTELAADQTFQIYNNRGDVDVFVDINGYYDNHNHDDLYPQKTATIIVPPSAFAPVNPTINARIGNIYGVYIESGSGTASLRAPLDLPVGSTITSITYHYTDSSAAESLSLSIVRTSLTTNSQGNVLGLGIDTTGASADPRSTTLVGPSFVVPDDWELAIGAFNNNWTVVDEALAVKGVRIEYTLP